MEELAELILEKSRVAFLCVVRDVVCELGVWLSDADSEDAIQEAVLGFWRGWRRKPGNEAYAFTCARNAARNYVYRCLLRSMREAVLNEEVVPLAVESAGDSGLPGEVMGDLFEMFLQSRDKKGARGLVASSRDVFITNAVYRGWSNEAIGTAMGVPGPHVRKYRQRIRQVLADQALRVQGETKEE